MNSFYYWQLTSICLMLATAQLVSCKESSKLKKYGYLTATIAQSISLVVFAVNGHSLMFVVAFIALVGWFRGVLNYWFK